MKPIRTWLRFTTAAIVVSGALASVAFAQDPTIENRLSDTEARFQQAKADNWQLYAPKTYDEAAKQLDKARERFHKGGKIEDINADLAKADKQLEAARQYAEIGKVVLTSAITARSDALTAGAPDHAPEAWKEAKETMYEAGRDVEGGHNNDARREATKAEQQFRDAELKAIRVDLLGSARDARKTAEDAQADEKASRTFNQGVADLQAAEKTLEGDRYQRAKAREQARAATEGFQHATYIARTSDAVGADDRKAFEDLQLAHEAALAEVAEVVNVPVSFANGISDAGAAIKAGVASLEADRNNLRDKLLTTNSRADSLDQALALVQEREESTAAGLRVARKRDADIRELRNLFSSDQATVIQQGDELICRLYGLSFPVGSAEIEPQNFLLLTKIQSALRIFPEAEITIEGHTDAAGDDDLNQRLSVERADAVRSYVVANMPADSTRIDAMGYGESVPLASNDTTEGRAKNRRIDIRLTDLYGPGGDVRYGSAEEASPSKH